MAGLVCLGLRIRLSGHYTPTSLHLKPEVKMRMLTVALRRNCIDAWSLSRHHDGGHFEVEVEGHDMLSDNKSRLRKLNSVGKCTLKPKAFSWRLVLCLKFFSTRPRVGECSVR